jgi:hypothetical protein
MRTRPDACNLCSFLAAVTCCCLPVRIHCCCLARGQHGHSVASWLRRICVALLDRQPRPLLKRHSDSQPTTGNRCNVGNVHFERVQAGQVCYKRQASHSTTQMSNINQLQCSRASLNGHDSARTTPSSEGVRRALTYLLLIQYSTTLTLL